MNLNVFVKRMILGCLRGCPNEAEKDSCHSKIPVVLDSCIASAKPVFKHSLDFRHSFSAQKKYVFKFEHMLVHA